MFQVKISIPILSITRNFRVAYWQEISNVMSHRYSFEIKRQPCHPSPASLFADLPCGRDREILALINGKRQVEEIKTTATAGMEAMQLLHAKVVFVFHLQHAHTPSHHPIAN